MRIRIAQSSKAYLVNIRSHRGRLFAGVAFFRENIVASPENPHILYNPNTREPVLKLEKPYSAGGYYELCI